MSMTLDKVKIGFLMTVLSISLVSVMFTQSFAEENILGQEIIRQNAIEDQMSVFSKDVKLSQKSPIEGFDRLFSKTDPGIGHENHQLAIIIPISDKEYTGTLYYYASEPIQLVSLKGPLASGEEAGKLIWTPDGKTNYELTLINNHTIRGEWNFVGNALAVHTFKDTPFVVDYKVDYTEVDHTIIRNQLNSVNDINIIAEFNFDSQTVKIDSFDVFKQISGFGKVQPKVTLQGIVGIDKSLLYRAADSEFNMGTGIYGSEHKFSAFGLSIYLEQENIPIRKMTYRDCDISNYTIDTLNDKDASYSRASVFVIVDNFEITCAGMQPYHYDYQKYIDEYGIDTVMKMKNMKMNPKTFKDYGAD